MRYGSRLICDCFRRENILDAVAVQEAKREVAAPNIVPVAIDAEKPRLQVIYPRPFISDFDPNVSSCYLKHFDAGLCWVEVALGDTRKASARGMLREEVRKRNWVNVDA